MEGYMQNYRGQKYRSNNLLPGIKTSVYSMQMAKGNDIRTSYTLKRENKRLETAQGSSHRELVEHTMEWNPTLCRNHKEWGRASQWDTE